MLSCDARSSGLGSRSGRGKIRLLALEIQFTTERERLPEPRLEFLQAARFIDNRALAGRDIGLESGKNVLKPLGHALCRHAEIDPRCVLEALAYQQEVVAEFPGRLQRMRREDGREPTKFGERATGIGTRREDQLNWTATKVPLSASRWRSTTRAALALSGFTPTSTASRNT